MTLDDMVKGHGSWLESGVDEGPVISSRIRLARNIEEYSFPGWENEEGKRAIWEKCNGLFFYDRFWY